MVLVHGVLWERDFLTYYFDGQEIGKVATPRDMNKPMYMLANLAVGGDWGGRERRPWCAPRACRARSRRRGGRPARLRCAGG